MAQATGCRRIVLPMLTTIFSVVTAASFARVPAFFASRAALAYWRFNFCFCHIRARTFFFNSGLSYNACR